MKLSKEKVLPIIMAALAEDVASGDITSALIFEKDENVMAEVIANEDCVPAGLDVLRWIFDALDERIVFRPLCADGDSVKKGRKVAVLKGSVKNILAGERTALNFLGRLSGVATSTSRFTAKVKGTKAKIFDTRKTLPGLRVLEKYAVRVGGGSNHRMGLWDGVLIKDNHITATSNRQQTTRGNAIRASVKKAKAKGYRNIEIEVDNFREFKDALAAGADIIMLDNMKIEDIKKAVRLAKSKAVLEVSGGVDLENVARIARTGIQRISIGALTHSAPSVDFSLEICR